MISMEWRNGMNYQELGTVGVVVRMLLSEQVTLVQIQVP